MITSSVFKACFTGLSILAVCVPAVASAAVPLASADVVPNDPYWEHQWYLRQINAPQAWTVTTGAPQVVVAVIDGPVDIDHPNLKDVIWTNPNETAADGLDHDHDGYANDLHGWNFVRHSPDVRPHYDPHGFADAWRHGTLVSSLISARGNQGIGMAGVAWNVRLMPLVVLDEDGNGSAEDIVLAIRYAVAHGANIINMSLAGYDYDQELQNAIRAAAQAGILVVAATGNDNAGKAGVNVNVTRAYPACMHGAPGENLVIGVSGTDTLDQKAPYANFGSDCTDIAAPAQALFGAEPELPVNVSSTGLMRGYVDGVTGTSMAAPLVSGVAALIKSARPDWTASQIRERLLNTADSVEDTLKPSERGGLGHGRLNAGRALAGLGATSSTLSLSLSATGPTVSTHLKHVGNTSFFSVERDAETYAWQATAAVATGWLPTSHPLDPRAYALMPGAAADRLDLWNPFTGRVDQIAVPLPGAEPWTVITLRQDGHAALFLSSVHSPQIVRVDLDALRIYNIRPLSAKNKTGIVGTRLDSGPQIAYWAASGHSAVFIVGEQGAIEGKTKTPVPVAASKIESVSSDGSVTVSGQHGRTKHLRWNGKRFTSANYAPPSA